MDRITIIRPDDWHLHLRDHHAMADVVGWTSARFERALVMPNLAPPIRTVEEAMAYRQRILAALPAGQSFQPYLALYLTPETTVVDVEQAAKCPDVLGIKLYPAGATTHSSAGVHDVLSMSHIFEAMQEHDLVLQIHGETTDPNCDPFDREKVFIEQTLQVVAQRFPQLRIVLEHVTTRDAVDFVSAQTQRMAATITPQHLLYDRRAIFAGGIRPHYFCLPILKRQEHRLALLNAATSGNSRYFLGTDSAPHARGRKETACGCAGMFSAHAGIELYAEAFDQAGALDQLEAFASRNGANFYRLPLNEGKVTLVRRSQSIPESLPFGAERLVPMRAGETVAWSLESSAGASV